MPGGRTPLPPELRLILNTHRTNRHGKQPVVEAEIAKVHGAYGPLVKPDDLSPAASECWDNTIAKAFWLHGGFLATAIIYCELWAEKCQKRDRFPASKIAIWRAFGRDLGLGAPKSRARFGV